MKRGDILSVSLPRDYGKPRPAVVIQADFFADLHSLTVLPLTSDLADAERSRTIVEPTLDNGLRARSQIMVEKISTIPREKAGPVIGRLSEADMAAVNRILAIFLGLV